MLKRLFAATLAAVILGATANLAEAKRHKGHGSDAAPAAQTQKPARTRQTPPKPGMVWANPKSKVFHQEGSQHYGATAQGTWMTETDAKAQGYRQAGTPKSPGK